MQTVLEIKNLKKSFTQANHKIEVIKEANIAVNSGELVALVGPSGSGKTTMLQIVGLLDIPDAGEIHINNINASQANDNLRTKIRKENIGFVYQSHHLLPEFSALENVALPLLIQNMSKKDAFNKAEEILTQVNLADRLTHRPSQLSGGQQQRVAIARAIVTKPSLILADEPTGNLDTEMSDKIFEILKDLTKSNNIGSLVVTHNMDLAKKADRIITINNGFLT